MKLTLLYTLLIVIFQASAASATKDVSYGNLEGIFNESKYPFHIPTDLPPIDRPPMWLRSYLPPPPQRYKGLHNNLRQLLNLRASTDPLGLGRWVAVLDYTLGQRDFFLNVLYSFLFFGQGKDFFIVANSLHSALIDCIEMQLPCYNSSLEYAWIRNVTTLGQYLHADHIKDHLQIHHK